MTASLGGLPATAAAGALLAAFLGALAAFLAGVLLTVFAPGLGRHW